MNKKVGFGPLMGVILGIVIIVIGLISLPGRNAVEMGKVPAYDSSSETYRYCAFGGDFYTEMFGVTRSALLQLNSISGDLAANFKLLDGTVRNSSAMIAEQFGGLAKTGSLIIIAIGMAVVAVSLCNMKISIADGKKAEKPAAGTEEYAEQKPAPETEPETDEAAGEPEQQHTEE